MAIFRAMMKRSASNSPEDAAEVEIVCPCCGYRLTRTVARLRRDTKVVCANCGQDVVPHGLDNGPDLEP
jgi:hypothetical protein